jgi:hypothetical protein
MPGALFRFQAKQVLIQISRATTGDFIPITPCKNMGQRAFAGSIRAHDRVDFAGVNLEVKPLEYFDVADASVQIGYF